MDDVRQSHDIGTCLTISHERFAETWEYLTRDTALPAAVDEQSDARGGLDIRLGRWQIFRSAPVILAVRRQSRVTGGFAFVANFG